MDNFMFDSVLGWVTAVCFSLFGGIALYKEVVEDDQYNKLTALVTYALVCVMFFAIGFMIGQAPKQKEHREQIIHQLKSERETNLTQLKGHGYKYWEKVTSKPTPMRIVDSCITEAIFTDSQYNVVSGVDSDNIAAIFCLKE